MYATTAANLAAINAAAPKNALVADHYRDEVGDLMIDRVLLTMYHEIPADFDLGAIDMITANREYANRGGKNARTIGGVHWALRALRAAGR